MRKYHGGMTLQATGKLALSFPILPTARLVIFPQAVLDHSARGAGHHRSKFRGCSLLPDLTFEYITGVATISHDEVWISARMHLAGVLRPLRSWLETGTWRA